MDSKGNWHNTGLADQLRSLEPKEPAFRPVIEIEIGATVSVEGKDGTMQAEFLSAEKNRVTLRPIDMPGQRRPYFEFGENVMLSNGTAPPVRAHVWDNRNERIILRTLPIH